MNAGCVVLVFVLPEAQTVPVAVGSVRVPELTILEMVGVVSVGDANVPTVVSEDVTTVEFKVVPVNVPAAAVTVPPVPSVIAVPLMVVIALVVPNAVCVVAILTHRYR